MPIYFLHVQIECRDNNLVITYIPWTRDRFWCICVYIYCHLILLVMHDYLNGWCFELCCFFLHVLLVHIVVKKGYKYGRIAKASISRLTWCSWYSCNSLEGIDYDFDNSFDLWLLLWCYHILVVFTLAKDIVVS